MASNPNNDGKSDPVCFPGAYRGTPKIWLKMLRKKGEGSKVAVRNIRCDANDGYKKLEKEEDVSEDEIKELEDKVQKLTDKYIKDVDAAVEAKARRL